VLFVTGRAKRSIEDHFNHDDLLSRRLVDKGKPGVLDELLCGDLGVRFFYTRQSIPLGTADAVLQGREFVGDETFVVMLGDSILRGGAKSDLLRRMMSSHSAYGASATIAVERVPREHLVRYGVVRPRGRAADEFEIADVVEKPSPETAPSDLALAGRYIFEPAVFDSIVRTTPSPEGELLLPDTIRMMINEGHVIRAVRLIGDEKRYDIGNFESYFKAFIDFALEDEEYGDSVLQHLRQRLERYGQLSSPC